MPPKVSIIIPCYNQGHYIKAAIESVESCDAALYELIIVNDGSTDDYTNQLLSGLSQAGYHVIFQENKGLAGARNAGLAAATAEYILPLDADNMIKPAYVTKGIDILDNNPEIAVVYGDAQYFGEKDGVWQQGHFNLQHLMINNYIDACAVVRKTVLDKMGGYDPNMKYMGWEDWNLWLGIAFRGYLFRYINEPLFDYRVVAGSMGQVVYSNYEKPNTLEKYIHDKYPAQMGHEWITSHFARRFKKTPFKFILKLIMYTYFNSYYKKLLAKNKIRPGI